MCKQKAFMLPRTGQPGFYVTKHIACKTAKHEPKTEKYANIEDQRLQIYFGI